MRKGQTHPSTVTYQNFIIDSCFDLLQQKPLNEITITQICDEAQISRRTFYRHFKEKEDIITFYIDFIMQSLTVELGESITSGDVHKFAATFFRYLMGAQSRLRAIQENGYGDQLFTAYLKCILPLLHATYEQWSEHDKMGSESMKIDSKISYTMGGLWSLFIHWLNHGCVLTPEELAGIVAN